MLDVRGEASGVERVRCIMPKRDGPPRDAPRIDNISNNIGTHILQLDVPRVGALRRAGIGRARDGGIIGCAGTVRTGECGR